MEDEILAAEIWLHKVDTSEATADIDEELNKIETELKSYNCTASMFDYSIAVISGILAGAIDAFIIGETPIFGADQKPISKQLVEGAKQAALKFVTNEEVERPVLHRAVEQGIPTLIPMLEKYAYQPTPKGLAAAVLIQFGRGGMLNITNDDIKLMPEGFSKEENILIAVVAVFVGIMKWLSRISDENGDPEQAGTGFVILNRIRELIRSVPAFNSVVNEIEKWQKQLPNELKCGDKKNSASGIEGTFANFFIMLGGIPAFKNTGLEKTVNTVLEAKRLGLNEVPIINNLTRQAIPVLFNEVIVRTVFFASRLVKELSKNEVSEIDWSNVIPFGNRDIDRLIALSSVTLTVADVADAALHAALDSCGEMVLFATKFVTRFNFVAAGRMIVAVNKERNNVKAEQELIHMKRLLMEAKTARAMEVLQAYQDQLEKRVSEYLTEDIIAFMEGLDCMDQGLAEKNSDLVIKGNVIIQRVLGREPQFTNQQEFDELMDSDLPLKL